MPSIIYILQFLLLITIALLSLKTISLISETRTSRGFVLKGYLQKEEVKEEEISSGFLERLVSYSKYKDHIERQLEDAHMNTSFTSFMTKRLILAAIFTLTGIGMYLFTHMSLYLYISIPLGIIAFQMPKRAVGKNKSAYENQIKIELPEYLSAFAVLLQTYSPYEATKKSVEYAGPTTRPYVEELISQIELYPANPKPYEEFAKNIRLREAKEFMVALQQIMKVNSEDADQIIQDQIKIMDELQEETYNEQIEARPDQVEKYIMGMLIPLVGVALTFIFILIADSFSNI